MASACFFIHIYLSKGMHMSSNTSMTNLSCYSKYQNNKDTRNCPEKAMKISHFNPNQSAPSIYIMIELCYFSLDQWEIRIHLLWGKSFNIPLHCDPHLNQTKFNDLLSLTIIGVLESSKQCKRYPDEVPELNTSKAILILHLSLTDFLYCTLGLPFIVATLHYGYFP